MVSILREIVDKLINGFFEYDCGNLTFSVPKIDAVIPPGELYEGAFTLKSASDTLVKGYIYTSSMRLVCRTDSFEDVEKEIRFVFDPTGLEAGDVVKGDVRLFDRQFHDRILARQRAQPVPFHEPGTAELG